MSVDELINKLSMLREMGYGDSQVLYDYHGDIQSVQVQLELHHKGFYVNLSPVELDEF